MNRICIFDKIRENIVGSSFEAIGMTWGDHHRGSGGRGGTRGVRGGLNRRSKTIRHAYHD
jgi:hypothetical protein